MASSKPAAQQLADIDHDKKLPKGEYGDRLDKAQARFEKLHQAYYFGGHNAVVVFEGFDAAGKGGAIRRMSEVMDPRGFKVWPIAAPSENDLKRHYLARFWDKLPEKGQIAVFDRSWYGRVLVERVEGFASEPEWRRAYDEINTFEKMLVDGGTHIAKQFLVVDREEQLERFTKRLEDPMKRWKLSPDDFRNRDKWDAYRRATDEMLERTDTAHAPWTVISGNHKKFARVKALNAVADRLEIGVDLSPPPVDPEIQRLFEAETKGK